VTGGLKIDECEYFDNLKVLIDEMMNEGNLQPFFDRT
jgi:hypothetical protein